MITPDRYRDLERACTLTAGPDGPACTVYRGDGTCYGLRLSLKSTGETVTQEGVRLQRFSGKCRYYVLGNRLCMEENNTQGAQALWQDSGEGWEITDYVPLTDGTIFLSLRRECKAQSPFHTATELGYRNDLDHGFTRRYAYRLLGLHGNQAEVFSEGDTPFRHLTAWGDRLFLAARRWVLLCPQSHTMEEVDPDLIPGSLAPAARHDTLLLPGRDKGGRTVLHLCKPGSDEPPLPVRDLPDLVGIGSVYADLV